MKCSRWGLTASGHVHATCAGGHTSGVFIEYWVRVYIRLHRFISSDSRRIASLRYWRCVCGLAHEVESHVSQLARPSPAVLPISISQGRLYKLKLKHEERLRRDSAALPCSAVFPFF